MDLIQEPKDYNKKTFFNHVFSTTEEGKAEILNVSQYSLLAIVPVLILNKLIQRFIPEADSDKSSLEILIEILLQLIVIFCGIILIHRVITYIPTYSGFKYENLALTNVILAFLVIVLSIQSKLGIKANLLIDRLSELWNGPSDDRSLKKSASSGGKYRGSQPVVVNTPSAQHMPSQADYLDNSGMQSGMFPPAPVATSMRAPPVAQSSGNQMADPYASMGPAAANTLLGGSFGLF
jgi:hypothetical protein